jgi:hypothetical protein
MLARVIVVIENFEYFNQLVHLIKPMFIKWQVARSSQRQNKTKRDGGSLKKCDKIWKRCMQNMK